MNLGASPRSLVSHVFILVFPLAIVFVLLVLWSFFAVVENKTVAEERNKVELLRNQVEDHYVTRLGSITAMLQIIASNELVKNSLVDFDQRDRYLPPFITSLQSPLVAGARFALRDYKGRLVAGHIAHTLDQEIARNIAASGERYFVANDSLITFIEPVMIYGNQVEGLLELHYSSDLVQEIFKLDIPYVALSVMTKDEQRLYTSKYNESVTTKPIVIYSSIAGYPSLSVEIKYYPVQEELILTDLQQSLWVLGAVTLVMLLIGILFTSYIAAKPILALIEKLQACVDQGGASTVVEEGPIEIRRLASTYNKLISEVNRSTVSAETVDRMINSMNEGLVTTDAKGNILRANKPFLQMVDATDSLIFGKNFMQYFKHNVDEPGGSEELFADLIADVSRVPASEALNGTLISTQREIPTKLSVAQLAQSSESDSGFVIVVRDITDILRVETIKNEFISVVSHELRTPLTSINGAIKLMNTTTELNDDNRVELLSLASRNCDRLLQLVNDILDIEKFQSGDIEFASDELLCSELIQNVLRNNESQLSSNEIQVEQDYSHSIDELYIVGDKLRVEQVVTNLLQNAIKFSPSGTTITLEIKDLGERVRIGVKDQGPGVPLEQQAIIFERFMQADSSTARHYEGSGLGLFIAKSFTEKMQGHIYYEQNVPHGAVFYLEFPLFRNGKRRK